MSTNVVSTATDTHHQLPIPTSLITELAGLQALSHLDNEDRPLPAFVYNTKRRLPDGSWAPKDVFVNTLTGEARDEISCVLLHIKKSRRWATYSENSGMTEHCRSDDGVEGIRADGEVVDCATCPHRLWGRGNGQEAIPDCDIVYTMLGLDTDDGNPFIIRAKATSRKPVQRYLARYFLGKLQLPDGQRADLPLFTCKTRFSLTMPTGTYAVLELTKEEDCNEQEIRQFKAIFENLRGVIQPNGEDDNSDADTVDNTK